MTVSSSAFVPPLADVGKHIRSRTVDRLGNELGTFTADTRPSASDAALHAESAARMVALALRAPGVFWDGSLAQDAADVAALRAALTIETSYYSDGTDPDETGVDQLGRMFREQLAALIAAAARPVTGARRFARVPSILDEDPIT